MEIIREVRVHAIDVEHILMDRFRTPDSTFPCDWSKIREILPDYDIPMLPAHIVTWKEDIAVVGKGLRNVNSENITSLSLFDIGNMEVLVYPPENPDGSVRPYRKMMHVMIELDSYGSRNLKEEYYEGEKHKIEVWENSAKPDLVTILSEKSKNLLVDIMPTLDLVGYNDIVISDRKVEIGKCQLIYGIKDNGKLKPTLLKTVSGGIVNPDLLYGHGDKANWDEDWKEKIYKGDYDYMMELRLCHYDPISASDDRITKTLVKQVENNLTTNLMENTDFSQCVIEESVFSVSKLGHGVRCEKLLLKTKTYVSNICISGRGFGWKLKGGRIKKAFDIVMKKMIPSLQTWFSSIDYWSNQRMYSISILDSFNEQQTEKKQIRKRHTKVIGLCHVCNLDIYKDQETLSCPHCGNEFHKPHLEEWLHVKSDCPVCSKKILLAA